VAGRYHISTKPAPPGFPIRRGSAWARETTMSNTATLLSSRDGAAATLTGRQRSSARYGTRPRRPHSHLGGGYGGAFSGPGFDSIWLDMSEIVRPTRDGIHGREYISTVVVLGRHLSALQFGTAGRLVSELPPQLEIPIPVLFDPLPLPLPGHGAQTAVVRAAAQLGTLALIRSDDGIEALSGYGGTVAPLLSVAGDPAAPWVQAARLVEIEVDSQDTLASALAMAEQVQTANPRAVVGLRLPLASGSLDQVDRLAAAGIGMVHLVADEAGYELSGDPPRFLTDLLQEAHHRW